MFNLEDNSYEENHKNMPEETASMLLQRLAEYIEQEGLTQFDITLHGGEPTLWPLKRFESFFHNIKNNPVLYKAITLGLQSNLYKLPSTQLLDLLLENNVSLSLSLDGPKKVNDIFRITPSGKGSYESISRNLSFILNGKYRSLVKGILSVPQTDTTPQDYFQWVKSLPIKNVDVLFPIHYHYGCKPWDDVRKSEQEYACSPNLGIWYAQLFDCWWFHNDPSINIRLFNHVISLMLGSHHHVDALVNDTLNMFVVSSSGNIEYPDYYRVAKNRNAETPYNIVDHSIKRLHSDSGFQNLLNLHRFTPEECNSCDHQTLCGGGFLAGRNGPDGMVLNRRSVLCYDEMYLFQHIKKRVLPTLEVTPNRTA